jgi:hypothetical protein
MQVTLLAPKYCVPTPLSLVAVPVPRLEDRGSNVRKPDYWLTAFSYFFVASGPRGTYSHTRPSHAMGEASDTETR